MFQAPASRDTDVEGCAALYLQQIVSLSVVDLGLPWRFAKKTTRGGFLSHPKYDTFSPISILHLLKDEVVHFMLRRRPFCRGVEAQVGTPARLLLKLLDELVVEVLVNMQLKPET